MKNVTLPILLASVSVVMIIVVAIFSGAKDKTGPEIEYSDSCITLFSDSDDVSILLDGVKAKDKKDGDVSDSVRIQNITVLKEEGRIIVRYSAKDKNNNITESERSIDYDGVQDYIDFSVLDEEMFEDNVPEIEESNEITTPVASTEPSTEPSADETSSLEIESNTEQEETTSEPDIDNTPIDRAEVDATGIPQIRMKYHELTIPVGGDFYFMDALAEWYDDKDDVSRRVILLGEYDVNVPGVYEITYYVTDSDLNVSNREKLVLTVVE